jgi:hypothetical protein
LVPGIGTTSSPRDKTQASATWDMVQPLSRAIASIGSSKEMFYSKLPS